MLIQHGKYLRHVQPQAPGRPDPRCQPCAGLAGAAGGPPLQEGILGILFLGDLGFREGRAGVFVSGAQLLAPFLLPAIYIPGQGAVGVQVG